MILSDALALLRRGHAIRRSSMGTGYVFLAGGGRIVEGVSLREAPTSSEESPAVFLYGAPENLPVEPALCLRTPEGTIVIGWRPSAADIFADDWQAKAL